MTQITSLFKHNQTSDASEPFGDAELPLEPIAIPTAQEASKLPGKKLSNCLSKP